MNLHMEILKQNSESAICLLWAVYDKIQKQQVKLKNEKNSFTWNQNVENIK